MEAIAVGVHGEGAEEVSKHKKPEPVTVHGRPVKTPNVHFVGFVELDQGDLAVLTLDMTAEEAVGLATTTHQPDLWAVVKSKLEREVTRR